MDIPIEIFLSFIAFSLVTGIIGLWKKIPLMLFIAGGLMTFWAITTDNIQLGFGELPVIDSTENINYSLSYPMNVTVGSATTALQNANFGVAQHIVNTNSVLLNQPVSCIKMDLSRTGSPTGTATIGITEEDSQIIKSFGTIDVATIYMRYYFYIYYEFILQ